MTADPRELRSTEGEPVQEPLLPKGAEEPKQESSEDLPSSASVVQFSSPIFFGEVAEEEIRIDIVRIDAYRTCVSVKFSTEDVSAKAGEVYEETSGVVVFAQKEFQKTISIPFIRSGVWSATTELKVCLSEANGCRLGAYLHTCRVKVIDENVFPTSKFRETLAKGNCKGVPLFSLYWHYCKWNAVSAQVIFPTLLTLVMDQLKNITALIMISCDMYLVNVICNPKASDDLLILPSRELCAYLIAALHILPLALLYLWDWMKIKLDLEGRSALHLQKHMYRKYMNFSGDVLEDLGPETLQWALLTEAPKLAGGYMAGLNIVQVVVNVVMQIYFVAVKRPAALPFIIMVPAAIIAWGTYRELKFRMPGLRSDITKMTAFVQETSNKHELIRAYAVRPQMNADFVIAAESLQATGVKRGLHKLNTNCVLDWTAPCFIACFMVLTIHEALTNQIPLGTFLAIIHIIKSVAAQTLKAYDTFIDIVSIFGALRHVTDFLNKETEVRACKRVNRQRRTTSAQILRAAQFPDFDALPILCRSLQYSVEGQDLMERIDVQARQGSIVAVRGPAKSGKNTLLKLLSLQTFPTDGECYLPSHLRVLFVSLSRQFFERSLMHNLTLGCPNFSSSKDLPRLKGILQDLNLGDLIKAVDEELREDATKPEDESWLRRLSDTDKHKLDLARAFLMNPEVMVLAKPLALSRDCAQQIERLLREHVGNRGLRMPKESVGMRRPRTVIYSCNELQECTCADVVWLMRAIGRKNSRGQDVWTLVEEEISKQESVKQASDKLLPELAAPTLAQDKPRRSQPRHWFLDSAGAPPTPQKSQESESRFSRTCF